MKTDFQVVDYSVKYFNSKFKGSMPTRWAGKFVMIGNGKAEFIVFAPGEFAPYHADIVRNFCDDRGIAGMYDNKDQRFNIVDPEWTVSGGGKFDIDILKKTLRLFGASLAYGKYERRGLREKLATDMRYVHFLIGIE